MNFYGPENRSEHTVAGRLIPLFEALQLAITKASKGPLSAPKHSAQLPTWCHNICDQLAKTIFSKLVVAAPQAEPFDLRNYGRIIGVLLRASVFVFKDAPAILKREGLLDLTEEREQKIDQMSGVELLLPFASEKFQQPISNEDELLSAASAHAKIKGSEWIGQLPNVLKFLVNRPVAGQYQFLCGIPEGFIMVLNNEGEFSKKSRRFEVFLLLLASWPEIAEMQKSQPPKTRRDLLEWLEKQEGRQIVEDEKVFFELCGDVDLDLAPPGHPHKASQS